MKVLAIFIGGLFGFWLMSTTLFTLFGAVMVFDSGDWSKLIPFMWGQGFGRASFGLFLFVISPVIAIITTYEKINMKINLPKSTPDSVIAWYTQASGYFTCINLDALGKDASESEVREAFEEDQAMLESICTQLNALVTTNPYDD